MDEVATQLAAYLRQQANLGMPPYIFSDAFDVNSFLHSSARPAVSRRFDGPAAPAPRNAPVTAAVKPMPRKISAMPLPALKLGLSLPPAAEVPTAPKTEKRAKLGALYHEVKTCRKCGFADLRTHFVFGTGNPDAPFLIIGEAPGPEEDAQGQPFVGGAGELLTKMLAAINVDRKQQAFITNIIKCKPEGSRDPDEATLRLCSNILSRQIDIIAPKVILLLGKVAAGALLGSDEPIASLRLQRHVYREIPVFVTYHPAALLRNDSYRRPAWEDLKNLKTKLQEIGLYDTPNR